jgi:hypothetical protein
MAPRTSGSRHVLGYTRNEVKEIMNVVVYICDRRILPAMIVTIPRSLHNFRDNASHA